MAPLRPARRTHTELFMASSDKQPDDQQRQEAEGLSPEPTVCPTGKPQGLSDSEESDSTTISTPASVVDSAEEPVLRKEIGDIDIDQLEQLCRDLLDHDSRRSNAGLAEDDRMRLARAACRTLILGPVDLGVEASDDELWPNLAIPLAEVGPEDMPEARFCRLWLQWAMGAPPDDGREMIELVRGSLMEPFQLLAYRALAYCGQRDALGELLPDKGPFSIAQADAWLAASHKYHPIDNHRPLVQQTSSTDGDDHLHEAWAGLLDAEYRLAVEKTGLDREKVFVRLLPDEAPETPRNLVSAQRCRIAARAAAALVRARLGREIGDDGILSTPCARLLPVWERNYLCGLVAWAMRDVDAARTYLDKALKLNPHQTCTRRALAALMAVRDPAGALDVLTTPNPTYEMLVSRGAILLRLQRDDEADQILTYCVEDGVPHEPLRFDWPRGNSQTRCQAGMLKSALAARRGRWDQAKQVWDTQVAASRTNSQNLSHQLFVSGLELADGATRDGWRRDLLIRIHRQVWHRISRQPLVGSELFYRAIAAIDAHPDQAVADFTTLLSRRTWVEGQRRVGGAQLVYVGDALVRLDQIGEAVRAYDLADQAGAAGAKERLTLAKVVLAVESGGSSQEILAAADGDGQMGSCRPGLQMIVALGLLFSGDSQGALDRVQVAEEAGASPMVGRCLRALCSTFAGTPENVSKAELAALPVSPRTRAVLMWLIGEGAMREKVNALREAFPNDSMTECPFNTDVAVRHMVADLCETNQWDEAARLAKRHSQQSPVLSDLPVQVDLGRALAHAIGGELDEAQKQLGVLQKRITRTRSG